MGRTRSFSIRSPTGSPSGWPCSICWREERLASLLIKGGRVIDPATGTDALLDLLVVDGHIAERDRKSTRLNSSHGYISYAVFCLKKKKENHAGISSEAS